ncbi:uracil phosphoribosyltransferase [Parapusillimonas sp. SGNA-6]|uniref:uracil phosphoribosyltransferase n=1 Tax=Parapedobacter sp. SGR-10 TaxID=2710879 RepID=UPI0013D5700D|nr:uracil phosphoribosyltransferase [Parapedobacter sp. SGR-10]NGF54922.1 uracil phosphoribosyltransferase [Parapedobacter sp. SGR-10]NGM89261.1 uracil phosphoribosyltransferase [Parapusillimonas sp. SGNA-6]
MITILSKQNSVVNDFIAELRDTNIQRDRMRFRRNLERVGEMMAYEISKTLGFHNKDIETPLGIAPMNILEEQPVLVTIIRSGLPFHQGFLNVFDRADSGFTAAFRHTKKSGEFEIHKKYSTIPSLDEKTVIIMDPLIATGKSLVLTCKEILSEYNIKELHIASIIATEEGLQHVKAFIPQAHIWTGDVDNELTSKSFIVPGLGDAGDLAYGSKE